ncbi:Hypothetical predicted protein, partial [Pelobates cultripes]
PVRNFKQTLVIQVDGTPGFPGCSVHTGGRNLTTSSVLRSYAQRDDAFRHSWLAQITTL